MSQIFDDAQDAQPISDQIRNTFTVSIPTEGGTFSAIGTRRNADSYDFTYAFPLLISTVDEPSAPKLVAESMKSFTYEAYRSRSMDASAGPHEFIRHYCLTRITSLVLRFDASPDEVVLLSTQDRALSDFFEGQINGDSRWKKTPDFMAMALHGSVADLYIFDVKTFSSPVSEVFKSYSVEDLLKNKQVRFAGRTSGAQIRNVIPVAVHYTGRVSKLFYCSTSSVIYDLQDEFQDMLTELPNVVAFCCMRDPKRLQCLTSQRSLSDLMNNFPNLVGHDMHLYSTNTDFFRGMQRESAGNNSLSFLYELLEVGSHQRDERRAECEVGNQRKKLDEYISNFARGMRRNDKPLLYCKLPILVPIDAVDESVHEIDSGQHLEDLLEIMRSRLKPEDFRSLKDRLQAGASDDIPFDQRYLSGTFILIPNPDGTHSSIYKRVTGPIPEPQIAREFPRSYALKSLLNDYYQYQASYRSTGSPLPQQTRRDNRGSEPSGGQPSIPGSSTRSPASSGECHHAGDRRSRDQFGANLLRVGRDESDPDVVSSGKGASPVRDSDSQRSSRAPEIGCRDYENPHLPDVDFWVDYFLRHRAVRYWGSRVDTLNEIESRGIRFSPKGTTNKVRHWQNISHSDFVSQIHSSQGAEEWARSRGLIRSDDPDLPDSDSDVVLDFTDNTSDMDGILLKIQSALNSHTTNVTMRSLRSMQLVDHAMRKVGSKLSPNLERLYTSDWFVTLLLLQEIFGEMATKTNSFAADGVSYVDLDVSWLGNLGSFLRLAVRPVRPGINFSYMIMMKGFDYSYFGRLGMPFYPSGDGWFATQWETCSLQRLTSVLDITSTILKSWLAWRSLREVDAKAELTSNDYEIIALISTTALCASFDLSQILLNTKYSPITSLGEFSPIFPILEKYPRFTRHLYTLWVLKRDLISKMSMFTALENEVGVSVLNRTFKVSGIYTWLFPKTGARSLDEVHFASQIGSVFDARNMDHSLKPTEIYGPLMISEKKCPTVSYYKQMLETDTRHLPGEWHALSRAFLIFATDALCEQSFATEEIRARVMDVFFELLSKSFSEFATTHASHNDEINGSAPLYSTIDEVMQNPAWRDVRSPCLFPERLLALVDHVEIALRRKAQQLGLREIFVLSALVRFLVYIVESFARALCTVVDGEMLTKGEKKIAIVSSCVDALIDELTRAGVKSEDIRFMSTVIDQSKWSQNFMTPYFGAMLARISRHWPGIERIVMYCCTVLNLWTEKTIQISPEVVEKIRQNPQLKSFDEGVQLLIDEVVGHGTGILRPDSSGLLLHTGMCQGIFHYLSSLWHAMVMAGLKKICQTVPGLAVRTFVSSDDAAIIMAYDASKYIKIDKTRMMRVSSYLTDKEVPHTELPSELTLALVCALLCHSLSYWMVNLCCRMNLVKSAIAIAYALWEFNTIYFHMRSYYLIILSVILGHATGKKMIDTQLRIRDDANERQEIASRGVSQDILCDYMQVQGMSYYLNCGDLFSGDQQHLEDIFLAGENDSYILGYYRMEHPGIIGAASTLQLQLDDMEDHPEIWKYILNRVPADPLSNASEVYTALSLYPRQLKIFERFLQLHPHWSSSAALKELISSNLQILFSPLTPQDEHYRLQYITHQAVRKDSCYQTSLQAMAAMSYRCVAPLCTIYGMSSVQRAECISRGVLLPQDGLGDHARFSLLELAMMKWVAPAVEPPLYNSTLADLHASLTPLYNALKDSEHTPIVELPNTKRYLVVTPICDSREEGRRSLFTVALEKWGVRPSYISSDSLNSEFLSWSLDQPWLKSTLQGTALGLEMDPLSLMNYILSLSGKPRMWRVAVRASPRTGLSGYEKIVETIKLTSHTSSASSVSSFPNVDYSFMMDNIDLLLLSPSDAMREAQARARLSLSKSDQSFKTCVSTFLTIISDDQPLRKLLQTTRSYLDIRNRCTPDGRPDQDGDWVMRTIVGGAFYLSIQTPSETDSTDSIIVRHTLRMPKQIEEIMTESVKNRKYVEASVSFNLQNTLEQMQSLCDPHLELDWRSGALRLRIIDGRWRICGRVVMSVVPWTASSRSPTVQLTGPLERLSKGAPLTEADISDIINNAHKHSRADVEAFIFSNILMCMNRISVKGGYYDKFYQQMEMILDDKSFIVEDENVEEELKTAEADTTRLQNNVSSIELLNQLSPAPLDEIERYAKSQYPGEDEEEERATLVAVLQDNGVTMGMISSSLNVGLFESVQARTPWMRIHDQMRGQSQSFFPAACLVIGSQQSPWKYFHSHLVKPLPLSGIVRKTIRSFMDLMRPSVRPSTTDHSLQDILTELKEQMGEHWWLSFKTWWDRNTSVHLRLREFYHQSTNLLLMLMGFSSNATKDQQETTIAFLFWLLAPKNAIPNKDLSKCAVSFMSSEWSMQDVTLFRLREVCRDDPELEQYASRLIEDPDFPEIETLLQRAGATTVPLEEGMLEDEAYYLIEAARMTEEVCQKLNAGEEFLRRCPQALTTFSRQCLTGSAMSVGQVRDLFVANYARHVKKGTQVPSDMSEQLRMLTFLISCYKSTSGFYLPIRSLRQKKLIWAGYDKGAKKRNPRSRK